MENKENPYRALQARYDEQRIDGIHHNAPRLGYYKIVALIARTINNKAVTVAKANWKLTDEENFEGLFSVEILLDTLKRTPSKDYDKFFNGKIIDEVIHIIQTSKSVSDDRNIYIIEWELATPKTISLIELNQAMMQHKEFVIEEDPLDAYDELDMGDDFIDYVF